MKHTAIIRHADQTIAVEWNGRAEGLVIDVFRVRHDGTWHHDDMIRTGFWLPEELPELLGMYPA